MKSYRRYQPKIGGLMNLRYWLLCALIVVVIIFLYVRI